MSKKFKKAVLNSKIPDKRVIEIFMSEDNETEIGLEEKMNFMEKYRPGILVKLNIKFFAETYPEEFLSESNHGK